MRNSASTLLLTEVLNTDCTSLRQCSQGWKNRPASANPKTEKTDKSSVFLSAIITSCIHEFDPTRPNAYELHLSKNSTSRLNLNHNHLNNANTTTIVILLDIKYSSTHK